VSDDWIIRHRGIDWHCRTEQDALGVLVWLRDFRSPLGLITIEPVPSQKMVALLATLPNQAQARLL